MTKNNTNQLNQINIFGLSYFKILFLTHIFIVFTLLFYIGIVRNNMPIFMYKILIVLGIIIIIYHIYRLITKGLKDKIWNYLHILLFAPLLIYIGIKQNKTHRIYYDLILALSFSALGLNIYYLSK